MANIAIFRINYKSDFILTLNSDAGWMTPFCIKFWTGAPSQAFFVGWDGTTYTHCSYDPSEPTKLVVQFDDHHLPTGDLKFQIAYHFAMADFPNDTEDEVINPASITTEIDGQVYQVMLDFTGETAPEIEFSLPAYANEAQRIANEEQRIADEQTRIDNEAQRIQNEEARINQEQTRQDNEAQRIRNEQTRINQEEARVREFATLKHDAQEATTAANDAAALANQKAQLADDKAVLAQDAAALANEKAQLAADKAALANDAAALANEKAALAQQKAEYAKQQGDYAKEQGDYAKRKGDDAATQMQQQAQAFSEAQAARQTAYEQAEGTESGSEAGDGSRWGTFKANEAARDAKVDAKVADITNLQKAVAEGAVYDISANHLTEGVPTKYADLTAALGTDGVNVPVDKRKGGMSIKYIQSSDNNYVQARYMGTEVTGNPNPFLNTDNWAICDDEILVENPEYIVAWLDASDHLLFWIRKDDGGIDWAVGIPKPIKDFVNEKIAEILSGNEGTNIDGLNKIIAFLNDFSTSDTLASLLNTKVDKIDGKGLIDENYASCMSSEDAADWLEVETDNEDKLLSGRRSDGTKVENMPIEVPACIEKCISNSEWLNVTTDNEDKITEGTKVDGTKFISKLKCKSTATKNVDVSEKINLSNVAHKNLQEELGTQEGNWEVPKYYNENGYLANKTRAISDLIRKTCINGDAFYFVTDTHWEYNQKHSPAIIKQMNRLLDIPRLFHGGDMYHVGLSYDGYNMTCLNAYRNAMDVPNKVYLSDGNHEYIGYNNIAATYGDVFAEGRLFLDDVVYGGDNKNYYYLDNTQKKIRYIILYSWGEYGGSGNDYIYGFEDTAQLAWLRDTALNVESGWKIFLFAHGIAWMSSIGGFGTVRGFNNLKNVVDNYSGNGEIVAAICGHAHNDSIFMDYLSCPIICTTCDQNFPFGFRWTDEHGVEHVDYEFSDLIEPREEGTVNEQAFDTVIYDKDNSIIHFYRIGSRAMNRCSTFEQADTQVDCRTVLIQSLSVGNTVTLDTILDGTITWSTADSSVVSVNNGAVTGVATGNTVITAHSSNGDNQAFFIKVN